MPSILAYFETTEKAREVKNILEKKGINTVQIDRISEVPTDNTGEFNNPIANQGNSLAALTNTGGNELPGDVGPLLAASPAASGLSGDRVGSKNILMTVVTSEDKLDEALNIIRNNGGMA